MNGPAPLPTALKILRGNRGKRPLNRLEPILEAGVPEKPKDFDRFETREWNRIIKSLGPARALTKSDLGILLVACSALQPTEALQGCLLERLFLRNNLSLWDRDATAAPGGWPTELSDAPVSLSPSRAWLNAQFPDAGQGAPGPYR